MRRRCSLTLFRRRTLASVVLLLGIALHAGPAAAHAILIASEPAQGDRVSAGNIMIRLHYNSRIDRPRSRLVLMRPDHSQAPVPINPEGGPDEIDANVTLPTGDYILRWQVLAIDGHITRGDLTFTVDR